DSDSRRTIEDLVRRVEKIETAIEPKFQAHFVAAMGIPHSTEPYTQLRKVVQLPAAKPAQPRSGARAGRRRATFEG
ncbi:MAG: drug:proton antiporter, partial [Gammaproteobacteria bacterium]|nr:drug:proton antiporter [Gammaproteobacteria bacterium]